LTVQSGSLLGSTTNDLQVYNEAIR